MKGKITLRRGRRRAVGRGPRRGLLAAPLRRAGRGVRRGRRAGPAVAALTAPADLHDFRELVRDPRGGRRGRGHARLRPPGAVVAAARRAST